ncbi:uncharacterized protein [Dermacentor albipictus]|uniref:uncharacterized protein isoform X4 n=1 Tax=Dermacentor albipictus TaxID=60249 RepID=UPI0038FBF8A0
MSEASAKTAVTAVEAAEPHAVLLRSQKDLAEIERAVLEFVNLPANRITMEARTFFVAKLLQSAAVCSRVAWEASKQAAMAYLLQEQLAEARREAAELRRRLAVAEARLDGLAGSVDGPGRAGRGPAAPAGGVPAPSGAGGSAGSPAGRMDYAAALRAGLAPSAGADCGGPGGAAAADAEAGRPGALHKDVTFLTPVSTIATPARDVLRLQKSNVDPHAKNIRDVTLHHTSVLTKTFKSVDVAEEDAIENKSKIKVRETSQVRIADLLQEPQSTQPARGSVYCLPAVPPDILMMAQRHQAGKHFAGRQRILQWLHHDLYLYDMYPGRLYTEAARALTTKFPNLADATGTGYDSWREALRYKAKYERKKVRALTKEDTENLQPRKRAAVEECAGPVRCERPCTVQLEFRLLTNTPIMPKLEQVLQPVAEKIIKTARKKRHTENIFEEFDTLMNASTEDAAGELTLTAALCVLPTLVKERVDALTCHFDPAKVHYVPTVTFVGSLLTAKEFTVRLEGISIEENTLLEAIATQMALYWVLNIAFQKKAQRTFHLLCELLGVSSGLRDTPLVRVAHTLLSQ